MALQEIPVGAPFEMEQLSEIPRILARYHPYSQDDQVGFNFNLFT